MIDGLYKSKWYFLTATNTVTCVSDILDLHMDKPESNPIPKGNKGFMKTRIMILINFYPLQILKLYR